MIGGTAQCMTESASAWKNVTYGGTLHPDSECINLEAQVCVQRCCILVSLFLLAKTATACLLSCVLTFHFQGCGLNPGRGGQQFGARVRSVHARHLSGWILDTGCRVLRFRRTLGNSHFGNLSHGPAAMALLMA